MSKSRLAKLREYGEGVFKVVPLRAQKGVGSKKFTTIDEIVAEVKLLKLLDPIPGFARFREVHVVQGRFPPSFQAAWDSYKAVGKDCENPNPANKRAYSDQQLWAILEMDDAGVELEKFKWSSVFQVYDIFWGVAMGLARAEEYALFEHRDLHLGNVCLTSTRPDGDMQLLADVDAKQLEASSGFGISSLETTIIDYSLSRAELRLTDEPEEKVDIASTDLDSKGLFDAVGRDEDEILQRNTYRLYVKVSAKEPKGISR
jgi:serine/threonine-protein kinase haspin